MSRPVDVLVVADEAADVLLDRARELLAAELGDYEAKCLMEGLGGAVTTGEALAAIVSALAATGNQQVGDSCTHEWRTAGGGSQARRPLVCMKCNQHRDHMPQQVGEVHGDVAGVLAVMDELVDFEERHAEYEPRQNHEAREARAAVAELIEAAQAVENCCVRHDANDADLFRRLDSAVTRAKGGAA